MKAPAILERPPPVSPDTYSTKIRYCPVPVKFVDGVRVTVVAVVVTPVLQGFEVVSPNTERAPFAMFRGLAVAPPNRPPETSMVSALISTSDSMRCAVILAENAWFVKSIGILGFVPAVMEALKE